MNKWRQNLKTQYCKNGCGKKTKLMPAPEIKGFCSWPCKVEYKQKKRKEYSEKYK